MKAGLNNMTPVVPPCRTQPSLSRAAAARAQGDRRQTRPPGAARTAAVGAGAGRHAAAPTLVPELRAPAATARGGATETAPPRLRDAESTSRRGSLAATMAALWRRAVAFVRAHGPGACGAGLGASLLGVMLRPLATLLPGLAAAAGVAPLVTAPLLATVGALAAVGVIVYAVAAWVWPALVRRLWAEAEELHAEIDRRTRAMSPVARGASYGAAAGYIVAASLCTAPGAVGWGVLAGVAAGGLAVGGLLQIELACRRRWVRLGGGDPTSLRPLDADLAPGVRLALLVGLGAAGLAAASVGLGVQI